MNPELEQLLRNRQTVRWAEVAALAKKYSDPEAEGGLRIYDPDVERVYNAFLSKQIANEQARRGGATVVQPEQIEMTPDEIERFAKPREELYRTRVLNDQSRPSGLQGEFASGISEAYKADVAKTEGLQVSPRTGAVEAKPGYMVKETGEVVEVPFAVSREDEARRRGALENLRLANVLTGDRISVAAAVEKGLEKELTDTGVSQSDIKAAKDYVAFERTHVPVTIQGKQEWVSRDEWEGIPLDDRREISEIGIEAYNEKIEKAKTDFESNLRSQPSELQEAYKKGGVKAYNEAVDAYNRKIGEDKTKFDEAKATLKKYETKDGYDLADALRERDDKVNEAVNLLFPRSVIEKAVRDNKPALTIGTGFPKKGKETVKFLLSPTAIPTSSSERITGIEPGTVLEPSVREQIGNMPGVKAALVGVAVTALDPIPGDEFVALGVLATLLASYEIANVIKQYRKQTGELPKARDIVVITKDGQAFGILPESLKDTGYHPLIPPPYPQSKEEIRAAREMPRLTGFSYPEIERTAEGIKALQPEAIVLTTPAIRPEELTGQTAGLLLAKAKVATAERKLSDAVSSIDWDEALTNASTERDRRWLEQAKAETSQVIKKGRGALLPSEIQYIQEQAAIVRGGGRTEPSTTGAEKAKAQWIAAMNRIVVQGAASPALRNQARFVSKSYNEYLRKLVLLEAAKRSYISFVNPTPVKGKLSEQTLSAIAGYKLAYSLGNKGATSTSLEQALAQSTATAIKAGELAYAKAKTQGLTDSQANTKANQAIRSAVRQSTQTAASARTATRVATSARTATSVATGARTATRAATRTAARSLARTKALTKTAKLAKPIPRLPKGKKSQGEEWSPEDVKSAITWKDGFVGHALKHPYRRGVDERTFSVRHIPDDLKGLEFIKVRGPGSQEKSAVITGKLSTPKTVNIGNQLLTIAPLSGGRKADFKFTRNTRGVSGQLTIKGSGSRRLGRIYKTRMGGGTVLSRRPLRT